MDNLPPCKHWPPFYEVEENGVCVKREPVTKPVKYPFLYFLIPIGIVGTLLYLVLSNKKY